MASRLHWLALALLALALLGADGPSRNLDIYFIDVMGGAATLLVTPGRQSILIDSGWPGANDRDPERIVRVLKDVAGCDHLDALVTTHWHVDHYGGVEALAKRVRIGFFWDRGLPDLSRSDGDRANFPDGPKADDPLGIAYRKASQGRRSTLMPGQTLEWGGLKLLVLASGTHVWGRETGRQAEPNTSPRVDNPLCVDAPPDKPVDPSDNARSLALVFHLGKFDFLDCGDLTWNIEKSLVCPDNRLAGSVPVDVFQVTHHGMDSSNHPTLVKSIAPTVTVMNNGPRKGGSPATVRLLKSIPSIRANYQLHKNAATGPEDNTDPALIANTDPAGGQFIHISVLPDGSRYTVRIGTDGPERSFETR